MTYEQFFDIFAPLALQLRFTDADGPTAKAYYKALEDLELEFCALAAQRFAQRTDSDGASWFPRTGEWRAMAAKVEHERTEALRLQLRKLPRPLCAACSDTGFALNTETNRASRCACQKLRRLEILGRRPWPALPEHVPDSGADELLTKLDQAATALASTRGIR